MKEEKNVQYFLTKCNDYTCIINRGGNVKGERRW